MGEMHLRANLLFFMALVACSAKRPLEPMCEASAHRGLRTVAPDNTVASIKAALRSGIRWIELDVRISKDGELFLFHEKHIAKPQFTAPTPFFGKSLEELTTSEIRALCLGDQSHCEPVPTLCEALSAASDIESTSTVQLDLKGDTLHALKQIDAIRAACGPKLRILVQLEALSHAREIKEHFPPFDVLGRAHSLEQFRSWLTARPFIIQGDPEWLTEETIALAHQAGIRVLIKALSPERERDEVYQNLFERGCDVILTDNAVRVREISRATKRCSAPISTK